MGQEIVGLDTPVFVYFFQRNKEYFSRARSVLKAVEDGKVAGVFSAIGMIELFTGLKKQGRDDLAFHYKAALNIFPHLTVVGGLNEKIVDIASEFRVRYEISTPDAIHIATAIDSGAKKFITNDKGLKRIKEILVELL